MADKKNERPTIKVMAQTANTTGVEVETPVGTAWIIIGHDYIDIKPSGLNVRVVP